MKNSLFLDRALGCILGGAAGDTLGYAVEFSGYNSIIEKYGHPGIREFEKNSRGKALFSDDTQMTLFTAEGVLEAANAGIPFTPEDLKPFIEKAYLNWLRTQEETYTPGEEGLLKYRELWSRRAPGITCLNSLNALSTGHKVVNNSKGCGGVMRIAPIAVYIGTHPELDIDTASLAAGMAAEITHKHPASTIASIACARIIASLIRCPEPTQEFFRETVADTIALIQMSCRPVAAAESMARDLREAVVTAQSDLTDIEGISVLGDGWVADEALAIAVFCVMRHFDDFEKCLVSAVNHGGDSDSTGAIAGNILGAACGLAGIPDKFVDGLELREVLEHYAVRMV